jgi:endonuclease G
MIILILSKYLFGSTSREYIMKIVFFNRMSFPLVAFSFVLTAVLFACSESNGGEDATLLEASMDATRFESNAPSGVLSVETTASWTVKEADGVEWVSFSSTQGTGNAKINVLFTKNTSENERFAQLVVTAGTAQKHIYISQKASTEGGGTTTNGSYFEIPKDTTIENTMKITRFLPGSRSGMRNYTMFYDKAMKLAYWVAYPLTSSYIGSSGRSEAWGYDPLISISYQPVLFSSGFSGYSRGHQIPSADRTYNSNENSTTFFFSNMTAQNYNLNGGIWADLEGKIRTWMRSCDTMYVVTGAMIKTSSNQTIIYVNDNNGSKVALPKYYFKALAQKRGANYYTIAYKMNNADPGASASFTSFQMTVTDLERQTGFTFFPSLSAVTKGKIDSNIWN